MSPVEWGLVIAVVSLLVGIGALGYARRAARVSEEELELAREQATLRPKLVISLRTVVYHYRPPNPGSKYPQAAIVFDVTNDGRSAAHNVHCEARLDETHLELDDLHGANQPFYRPHIGPSATEPYQINVGVLSHGWTEARYTCVCDEVGKSEGTVQFEIPEREQADR